MSDDDEKVRDCIERQRNILRQLSVFRDVRKQITISLGDLRILCDEIDRLEREEVERELEDYHRAEMGDDDPL